MEFGQKWTSAGTTLCLRAAPGLFDQPCTRVEVIVHRSSAVPSCVVRTDTACASDYIQVGLELVRSGLTGTAGSAKEINITSLHFPAVVPLIPLCYTSFGNLLPRQHAARMCSSRPMRRLSIVVPSNVSCSTPFDASSV